MLSTDFSTPNFIHNTNILITLGNTSAETKDCTIAYNNLYQSRFLNHVFLYQIWTNKSITVLILFLTFTQFL